MNQVCAVSVSHSISVSIGPRVHSAQDTHISSTRRRQAGIRDLHSINMAI